MTSAPADVAFDMYDRDIYADPYPVFRQLRDSAPLYHNEQYGFHVVSRFEDIERVLTQSDVFSSSKGSAYSFMPFVISGEATIPSGLFIAEDGQPHSIHRGLVSRIFTPKQVQALEPQIRAFCARTLDTLVGAERFDYARDLAGKIPMAVIGMLLGIPEGDQADLREHFHTQMNEASVDQNRPRFEGLALSEELFGDYLDWRSENPSDDLMTRLLTVEYEDETGSRRRLSRDEVFVYVNVLAAAGSDTTGHLMGWTAKLLGEHHDQRRELVDDRALIPNAIEEILRFEPPSYCFGRYVMSEVELCGETLSPGNVVIVLPGSANHDERRFSKPDTFDIHRRSGRLLSFGLGAHLCIGAHLARLEGRVLLEEVLTRFPDWTVDLQAARLTDAVDTRGWESLPVITQA